MNPVQNNDRCCSEWLSSSYTKDWREGIYGFPCPWNVIRAHKFLPQDDIISFFKGVLLWLVIGLIISHSCLYLNASGPQNFQSCALMLKKTTWFWLFLPNFKLRLVSSRPLLLCNFFQLIIPEEVPLVEDVDFEQLARFDMTGSNIKSAVFRAASRAALRGEGRSLVVHQHCWKGW